MRKLEGKINIILSITFFIAAIVHIYINVFKSYPAHITRPLHLLFVLPAAFIVYPASKKSNQNQPSIVDIGLSFLSIIVTLYVLINYVKIQSRWTYVTPVSNIEMVLGVINIVLILEACRRAVTPVISVIALIGISYLFMAPYLPGILYHSGLSFKTVIEIMYLDNSNGIYGMLVGCSVSFIIMFVMFGNFMNEMGMGKFFVDFSKAIAGNQVGGPAKVAAVSSALFGTVSGSAVANVYTTGAFTIPLMKKLGYKDEFAAAVEAAASTGGQLMPPVMGATAFVLAELTGTPYVTVCKCAMIPAIFYFGSIFIFIHFESIKLKLKKITEIEKLPAKSAIIKDLYYFIPLILIVYLLMIKISPMRTAFIGIVGVFLISLFKKETMMTPKKIFKALDESVRNVVMVAIALSAAGIIVSVIFNTGLGISFGSIVLHLARGNLFIIIILIIIVCIIMGCGLPSTAAYILCNVLAVPILVKSGFSTMSSNMFIFYYALLAGLTPPVAIVAYAAAGLAKSDPIKTGYLSFKLASIGFIIPLVFLNNNYLLLEEGSFIQIIIAIIACTVGIIIYGKGIVGTRTIGSVDNNKKSLEILNRIFLTVLGMLIMFYRPIIQVLFRS